MFTIEELSRIQATLLRAVASFRNEENVTKGAGVQDNNNPGFLNRTEAQALLLLIDREIDAINRDETLR